LVQAGPHLIATERQNLTQMVLKSLCMARRDDRRYAAALAQGPRHSGRPVPNAMMVGMVKNEADIIHDCLASAYQAGLRYFVLADNGSTDGTGALIRAFAASHPDCVLLLLDDPIKGYWQATKTNLLWRFGQQYLAMTGVNVDWVLPLDADELLVQLDPAHDLASVLEQAQAAGKTVGVNMWCTATPVDILERLPEGVPMRQACPVVSGYDQSPNTKVFVRAQAGVTLEMGNHLVSGCLNQVDDAFVLAASGLFVLHHPYRSRSQWRSKIVNGYHALAASNLPASAGSHWRSAYQRYQQEGETYVDDVLRQYFSRNTASAARLQAEATALGHAARSPASPGANRPYGPTGPLSG
jgi:hypothetical protein